MFLEYIFDKLKYNNNTKRSMAQKQEEQTPVPPNIDNAEQMLKERFCFSNDFVTRRLNVNYVENKSCNGLIAYMDGMVRQDLLSESIIKPLLHGRQETFLLSNRSKSKNEKNSKVDKINNTILSTGEVKKEKDFEKAVEAILNGDCVLFLENSAECSIISCKGYEKRTIEQPSYEVSMRGPRESFNENLRTNTTLLRRRVKNSNLVFENLVKGRKTRTNLCITYINGLAEKKLVDEVKRRISKINVDMILESGYIEEYVEDSPFSIFATMGITERPDVLAAKLIVTS